MGTEGEDALVRADRGTVHGLEENTTMTNFDTLRERLRSRLTEPRSDYGLGECGNCLATLTQADVDAGECSQCKSSLTSDDEDCCHFDD